MRSRRTRSGALLIIIDIVLINAAFFISYWVRYRLEIPTPVLPEYDSSFIPYIPFSILLTVLCLITYRIDGLYDHTRKRRWLDQAYRIFSGTMTSILLVMAITFALQPLVYSRGMLVVVGGLIVIFLWADRLILQWVLVARRRRGIGVDRLIVVGMGELGRTVVRNVLADPLVPYALLGYVDDNPVKGQGALGRIKGLGNLGALGDICTEHQPSEVIITLPWSQQEKIRYVMDVCEAAGVRARVVPDVFHQRLRHLDMASLNGIPLLGAGTDGLSKSSIAAKRMLDLILTLLSMPFFLLIYAAAALAIKFDDGGPVIFRQRRVGRDGREFDVFKFRSMVVNAEELLGQLREQNTTGGPTFKVADDPRITRVGRFIRRTSIDELPQLINVLRGEMSLVGPRPGTPNEVAEYEPWHRERLAIVPGLTGLWQVSGRSEVPFDEMVLLDVFYIENWSLDLDIRIILQTVPTVLFRKGAY